MAKDATIEIIDSVIDHPNAEKLSICKVLGFQCITKKNQFKTGEMIIYVRPDTVFPEAEWATEYRKYSPKRIKSIKLRSQWSEGVILPLETLNNFGKIIE